MIKGTEKTDKDLIFFNITNFTFQSSKFIIKYAYSLTYFLLIILIFTFYSQISKYAIFLF